MVNEDGGTNSGSNWWETDTGVKVLPTVYTDDVSGDRYQLDTNGRRVYLPRAATGSSSGNPTYNNIYPGQNTAAISRWTDPATGDIYNVNEITGDKTLAIKNESGLINGMAIGVEKVPLDISPSGYALYQNGRYIPTSASGGALSAEQLAASGGGGGDAPLWTGYGPQGQGTYRLDGPNGTPGTYIGRTTATSSGGGGGSSGGGGGGGSAAVARPDLSVQVAATNQAGNLAQQEASDKAQMARLLIQQGFQGTQAELDRAVQARRDAAAAQQQQRELQRQLALDYRAALTDVNPNAVRDWLYGSGKDMTAANGGTFWNALAGGGDALNAETVTPAAALLAQIRGGGGLAAGAAAHPDTTGVPAASAPPAGAPAPPVSGSPMSSAPWQQSGTPTMPARVFTPEELAAQDQALQVYNDPNYNPNGFITPGLLAQYPDIGQNIQPTTAYDPATGTTTRTAYGETQAGRLPPPPLKVSTSTGPGFNTIGGLAGGGYTRAGQFLGNERGRELFYNPTHAPIAVVPHGATNQLLDRGGLRPPGYALGTRISSILNSVYGDTTATGTTQPATTTTPTTTTTDTGPVASSASSPVTSPAPTNTTTGDFSGTAVPSVGGTGGTATTYPSGSISVPGTQTTSPYNGPASGYTAPSTTDVKPISTTPAPGYLGPPIQDTSGGVGTTSGGLLTPTTMPGGDAGLPPAEGPFREMGGTQATATGTGSTTVGPSNYTNPADGRVGTFMPGSEPAGWVPAGSSAAPQATVGGLPATPVAGGLSVPTAGGGNTTVTPEQQSLIDEILNQRRTAIVPGLGSSYLDVAFNNIPPSQRAAWYAGMQEKYGVDPQDIQAEQQRYAIRGMSRGGLVGAARR